VVQSEKSLKSLSVKMSEPKRTGYCRGEGFRVVHRADGVRLPVS